MIVLDTHIWHWWVNQIPGKLSLGTIALIEESDGAGVFGHILLKWRGSFGMAGLISM